MTGIAPGGQTVAKLWTFRQPLIATLKGVKRIAIAAMLAVGLTGCAVVNEFNDDFTITETNQWIERCPKRFQNMIGSDDCERIVWMASNWVGDDLYSADCIRKTLNAAFSAPEEEYPVNAYGVRDSSALFYIYHDQFCG